MQSGRMQLRLRRVHSSQLASIDVPSHHAYASSSMHMPSFPSSSSSIQRIRPKPSRTAAAGVVKEEQQPLPLPSPPLRLCSCPSASDAFSTLPRLQRTEPLTLNMDSLPIQAPQGWRIRYTDVCIIGAGAAGLQCLSTLTHSSPLRAHGLQRHVQQRQRRVDPEVNVHAEATSDDETNVYCSDQCPAHKLAVLVLEGRDRIGGRIDSRILPLKKEGTQQQKQTECAKQEVDSHAISAGATAASFSSTVATKAEPTNSLLVDPAVPATSHADTITKQQPDHEKDGPVVELGAAFIHGCDPDKRNLAYNMAIRYNLRRRRKNDFVESWLTSEFGPRLVSPSVIQSARDLLETIDGKCEEEAREVRRNMWRKMKKLLDAHQGGSDARPADHSAEDNEHGEGEERREHIDIKTKRMSSPELGTERIDDELITSTSPTSHSSHNPSSSLPSGFAKHVDAVDHELDSTHASPSNHHSDMSDEPSAVATFPADITAHVDNTGYNDTVDGELLPSVSPLVSSPMHMTSSGDEGAGVDLEARLDMLRYNGLGTDSELNIEGSPDSTYASTATNSSPTQNHTLSQPPQEPTQCDDEPMPSNSIQRSCDTSETSDASISRASSTCSSTSNTSASASTSETGSDDDSGSSSDSSSDNNNSSGESDASHDSSNDSDDGDDNSVLHKLERMSKQPQSHPAADHKRMLAHVTDLTQQSPPTPHHTNAVVRPTSNPDSNLYHSSPQWHPHSLSHPSKPLLPNPHSHSMFTAYSPFNHHNANRTNSSNMQDSNDDSDEGEQEWNPNATAKRRSASSDSDDGGEGDEEQSEDGAVPPPRKRRKGGRLYSRKRSGGGVSAEDDSDGFIVSDSEDAVDTDEEYLPGVDSARRWRRERLERDVGRVSKRKLVKADEADDDEDDAPIRKRPRNIRTRPTSQPRRMSARNTNSSAETSPSASTASVTINNAVSMDDAIVKLLKRMKANIQSTLLGEAQQDALDEEASENVTNHAYEAECDRNQEEVYEYIVNEALKAVDEHEKPRLIEQAVRRLLFSMHQSTHWYVAEAKDISLYDSIFTSSALEGGERYLLDGYGQVPRLLLHESIKRHKNGSCEVSLELNHTVNIIEQPPVGHDEDPYALIYCPEQHLLVVALFVVCTASVGIMHQSIEQQHALADEYAHLMSSTKKRSDSITVKAEISDASSNVAVVKQEATMVKPEASTTSMSDIGDTITNSDEQCSALTSTPSLPSSPSSPTASILFSPPLSTGVQDAFKKYLGMGLENKVILVWHGRHRRFWPRAIHVLRAAGQLANTWKFYNYAAFGRDTHECTILIAHRPPPYGREIEIMSDEEIRTEVMKVLIGMFYREHGPFLPPCRDEVYVDKSDSEQAARDSDLMQFSTSCEEDEETKQRHEARMRAVKEKQKRRRKPIKSKAESSADQADQVWRKRPVTPPDEIYVTRWGSDPFALGAYSYIPIGGGVPLFGDVLLNWQPMHTYASDAVGDDDADDGDDAVQDAEDEDAVHSIPASSDARLPHQHLHQQRPCREAGVLLFAGEALDSLDPTQVHGAMRSGRRAAKTIIKRMRQRMRQNANNGMQQQPQRMDTT